MVPLMTGCGGKETQKAVTDAIGVDITGSTVKEARKTYKGLPKDGFRHVT